MNCLDFRRRLLEDPYTTSDDMIQHEESCPACAAYARDLRAKEVRLRALLNNIPVPAELPDKVRFAVGLKKRTPVRRRVAWAMAASVLLITGAVWMHFFNPVAPKHTEMPLVQSILHHAEAEWHHYNASQQVSSGKLAYLMDQFNAERTADLANVNFAAICPIRQYPGLHLAIAGKVAPITVFYMPKEHISRSISIASADLRGEIMPTSWGSIAVIGKNNEPLEGVAKRMAQAVEWPEAEAAQHSWPSHTLIARMRLIKQHRKHAHNAEQTHLD